MYLSIRLIIIFYIFSLDRLIHDDNNILNIHRYYACDVFFIFYHTTVDVYNMNYYKHNIGNIGTYI